MKSQALTRGFTLVELMLAVAITASLVGLGFVRYKDLNRTQLVKNAGLTLKNNLRDIETNSLTGIKPVGCLAGQVLTGYRVTIFATMTQYVSTAYCDASPYTAVNYYLPAGLIFHEPVAGAWSTFKPLGQGVDTARRFTIRTSGTVNTNTKWYSICVASNGNLRDGSGCGYFTGAVNLAATNCICN